MTLCGTLQAHEASTSYLYWHSSMPQSLRLDLSLTDVMMHLSDAPPETLSWRVLQQQARQFGDRIAAGISVEMDSPCLLEARLHGLTEYVDERFSVWQLNWHCTGNGPLAPHPRLDYQLLYAQDTLHRAVLSVQSDSWPKSSRVTVLDPNTEPVTLASRWRWATTASLLMVIVLGTLSCLLLIRDMPRKDAQ